MTNPIEHLNQLVAKTADDAETQAMDLWVPTEPILVFEQELPSVSRRKLQEMLPWMLEDSLLASPESYEFILGPETGSGTIVFAVERATLSRWAMLADSSGVFPARMVPDYFALPFEEGRWAVYVDSGKLLARTGLYTGFSADLDFGWQQLQLLLAQNDDSIRLSILHSSEAHPPEALLNRIDAQEGQINWGFTDPPVGIDILPATLKPKKQSALGRWWPAMGAAAMLVMFMVVYMLVQSWVWQRDIEVLEKAVADTYQQMFGKPPGSAFEAMDSANAQLSLMEHQYINLQTSPMAELHSLDRIFSTCADCALMSLDQTEAGLSLRLKDSERLRSRLAGVTDWRYSWSAVDDAGFSTISVEVGQ